MVLFFFVVGFVGVWLNLEFIFDFIRMTNSTIIKFDIVLVIG